MGVHGKENWSRSVCMVKRTCLDLNLDLYIAGTIKVSLSRSVCMEKRTCLGLGVWKRELV